jgi:hypothetical protein
MITDSLTEEYYVVGDIHGDLMRLNKTYTDFVERRKTNPNLKLIYLGDYLDRGLFGTEIITTIQHIQRVNPDVYFLLGNHEVYKYRHTLSVNDPTAPYNDRILYFKALGLTFYLGYYNTAQKLLFTHAGTPSPKEAPYTWLSWCSWFNTNIVKNRVVDEGDIVRSLLPSEVYAHNCLFYSIAEHLEPIWSSLIKPSRVHSDIVQVFGHWHVYGYSTGTNNFDIISLENIDRQNVKYILLDCSDRPLMYCLIIKPDKSVEVLNFA